MDNISIASLAKDYQVPRATLIRYIKHPCLIDAVNAEELCNINELADLIDLIRHAPRRPPVLTTSQIDELIQYAFMRDRQNIGMSSADVALYIARITGT